MVTPLLDTTIDAILLAYIIDSFTSLVSKYFKVNDAVNVSPAPLTSIVSCGFGLGYILPLNLVPLLPRVIKIFLHTNNSEFCKDSFSFNFTNEKLFSHIEMTNFSGLIKARNIIATIPGAILPNEKVVVGGHLDSWDLATGAIDNGIGSFSVLDMARTFQALKLNPARTVEFILFMGEEEGLLGSKAYVAAAKNDKSIDQIRYMFNYDMTNDPKGFSTSSEDSRTLFQSIGAIANKIDTNFKNSISVGAGLHSDHQPFMLQGIPTGGGSGGGLPNGAGPCYHADCDGFNLVDEKGMKNTVRYGAMLLYGVADATEIKSKHLTDQETKQFLIDKGLKEALQIAGDWRWKD